MKNNLFSIKVGKGKYMYIEAAEIEQAVVIFSGLGNPITYIQQIRVVKRPRWKSARIYKWEDAFYA